MVAQKEFTVDLNKPLVFQVKLINCYQLLWPYGTEYTYKL